MKQLLSWIFFVTCISASAQKLYIAPMLEKTASGLQYGSILLLQTASKWGFGAFYQVSFERGFEGMQFEDPFIGILINVPVSRSEKVNVYAQARAGLSNNNFFAFAPGLETELNISRSLSISAVLSMRMSNPAAMGKVNFKLQRVHSHKRRK